MLIQTQHLTGPALDWAVAVCEALPLRLDPMGFGSESPGGYWVWAEGFPPAVPYMKVGGKYSPSNKLEQGCPIIFRERIHMCPILLDGDEAWQCWVDGLSAIRFTDKSALVAAMRAYVHSKLGHEIDVPAPMIEWEAA